MEEDQGAAPRRQYENFRSNSSSNWRVRDDNARESSPQQQGRFRREDRRNDYGQSEGYGRRENQDYQRREPREPREIPGKPESPRLYVGNLLYTAQANDISNFFMDHGFQVANVSMTIDPATGRNPSYCFVDLESVEAATQAMEQLNGAEVLGRSVRINPGVARKDGQGGSGGPRRGYGESRGGGGGWRERESRDNFEGGGNPRASNERWGQRDRNTDASASQTKRLYVGGLPSIDPSSVESEITTLFSQANPPIQVATISNLIAPHPSKAGEPGDHHYLFVDLKSDADADRAIEMFNDVESPWSDGGRLRVNRAREARDRGDRDGFSGGRGRGPREGGRGGGMGFGGRGGGGGGGGWRASREDHAE